MIFVDSGAWFASVVPWDQNHVAATNWLGQNTSPLFTTDYVVDETLTLLRIRNERQLAEQLGSHFFSGGLCKLHYLTPDDVTDAWRIYLRFSDKDWSFTDCTSKVVMQRLSIATAFSFDHHFRQFGTVTVVP